MSRHPNGKYKSEKVKKKIHQIVAWLFILVYLSFVGSMVMKDILRGLITSQEQNQGTTTRTKVDLTEQSIKDKIEVMENTEEGMTWYVGSKPVEKIYVASISKYSRTDSCHNKRGGQCLTAIGKDTQENKTVACPRQYKLKRTTVTINGKTYTCEDRTAIWVQNKYGDTFDIFTESHDDALAFGRKTKQVRVTMK